MVRYLIAAVLACIYLAGSIWIVSSQGQLYRHGLSKRKLAARANEKPALPLPKEKGKTVPTVVTPGSVARRPVPEPARVTIADSLAAPAVKPPLPAQPATERAKAEPATSPGADRAPAGPANPFANNPFWNQPHLTKVWDLSLLKPDDEMRLGAELHDLIVQFNPLVDDDPRLVRVYEAAEPLLKDLHRKEIKYQFFIVNSDEVNAFSHPGGYIYISRGLFDLIGEDQDYALQFAIGHEIAHVDWQHAIRCLRDPDVKNINQGTLQKLYWLIIPFGYMDSNKVVHEFEADEWVANRMLQIGRTRRETLNFLQVLDGYAKNHGFWNGHDKPNGKVSPLENHYRAQTATWKRLKHLKEFMAEAAKAPK